MNLENIPPRNRRAILVLLPEDLTRLEYISGGNFLLLNEHIYLLNISNKSDSSLQNKLEKSGLLEVGNLLIQNPYNLSNYALLDQAFSSFALEKYIHFTTLCGLLGAREVTVEQIEVKTSKGKKIFKGDLNNRQVAANFKKESKTFEEIRSNIKLKSTFNGGVPNLDAAEVYLDKYNLANDISMKSLIDQRKGNNPIQSRELVLSISEESNKNLKVISDMKVPVYVELESQLEQVRKEFYDFNLALKVQF